MWELTQLEVTRSGCRSLDNFLELSSNHPEHISPYHKSRPQDPRRRKAHFPEIILLSMSLSRNFFNEVSCEVFVIGPYVDNCTRSFVPCFAFSKTHSSITLRRSSIAGAASPHTTRLHGTAQA